MSCLYIIKQGMEGFTESEKKIGKYILSNKNEVINLSAQELSEKVSVSAAGVVRFAKKIGFKGFIALKVELAKENDEEIVEFSGMISEEDDTKTMIKKAIKSNINTLEQTYKLINMNVIEEAINTIVKAKKIYIYGIGASGLVALDFQYKLLRIKKDVIYNNDSHIQLSTASHIESDDVAIGISYSGETKEINVAINEAKTNGAKVIAITRYNNSTLSKISDMALYIPNKEKELRLGAIASRMSALTLIDILYLGIVKNDIPKTKDYITDTRRIIEKIK
ncbi:MAG: MurR/RpiR family transcriptional regulator [Clostridium baratii]|uniref:MurR/RpiR family transcriptional regulator n=1 Tax=Clostridium baratii TaxID=1561 RepID=UPI00242AFCD5|nr:MurR/RpiR family transcriptional regulator [Clostridium baratii]MBS6041482.1 MurR/RpiR family transcriptional regulator [Clostridium baratii]